MSNNNVKRQTAQWPTGRLRPHPQQARYFSDLPSAELQALADDLSRNGQLEPIEILPDGTVISGHQRLRAAQALGWKEVEVWVRGDLKKEGPKAVEKRFHEANMNRRHLSDLDKARVYLRLKEIERGKTNSRKEARGDLRDHLADKFGVSGRTLDRWARILEAPIEVQKAYESGQLGVDEAGRVADTSEEDKELIAQRIRAGEDPQAVVTELAPPCRKRRRTQGPPVHKILNKVSDLIDELGANMEDAKQRLDVDDLPLLRKAGKCLVELARHIKEHPEECLTQAQRFEQLAARQGV